MPGPYVDVVTSLSPATPRDDTARPDDEAAFRHRDRLRVLALVQWPPGRAPSQRFRLEQWAPRLEQEHGIILTASPFASPELVRAMERPGRRARKLARIARDLARRWARRHDAVGHDAVVVAREAAMIGGPWVERWITARGIPLIYDFDDAVWLRRADGGRGFSWLLRMPGKTADICRMASHVTAGSELLAEYARRFTARVTVVPTSIELQRSPVQPEPRQERPFRVVWSGSRATLQYLALAVPALAELGRRVPTVLRVICDGPPPAFANLQVEYIPWTPTSEVEGMADTHVGIMPLPDTPTARGKCGLKALQYMAAGRAVVVSPVGVNRQIVRHGENGLLAHDESDWVAQLERLAHDRAARERLGAAGRRTVEAGYSAERSAAAFARVVRRAVAEHERTSRSGR